MKGDLSAERPRVHTSAEHVRPQEISGVLPDDDAVRAGGRRIPIDDVWLLPEPRRRACCGPYPEALEHEREHGLHLRYAEGSFPVAEQAVRTAPSLPIYPDMPAARVEPIVDAVRGYFAR